MSPPCTYWSHKVSVERFWVLHGSLQRHREPSPRLVQTPSHPLLLQTSRAVLGWRSVSVTQPSAVPKTWYLGVTSPITGVPLAGFAFGRWASSAALQPGRRDGVAEQRFGKDWAYNEQKSSTLWIYVSICKTMKACWSAFLVDLFGTAAKLSSAQYH